MKTYTFTFNEDQLRIIQDALFVSAWMSYKKGCTYAVEKKTELNYYLEQFSK